MNKKLLLPVIIFLSMLVTDITSIIAGVQHHQAWRVVIASASLVLILAVAVVVLINKKKKKTSLS